MIIRSLKLRRNCKYCGKEVPETRNSQAQYCNNVCYKAKRQADDHTETTLMGLPSGTVGALHELVVAELLIRKGYHVFRAMSPACPCDLMIFNNTGLYRVEVTTGNIGVFKRGYTKKNKRHQYDYLAVVYHDGVIEWFDAASSRCTEPPH